MLAGPPYLLELVDDMHHDAERGKVDGSRTFQKSALIDKAISLSIFSTGYVKLRADFPRASPKCVFLLIIDPESTTSLPRGSYLNVVQNGKSCIPRRKSFLFNSSHTFK